jgi:amino acid transporter
MIYVVFCSYLTTRGTTESTLFNTVLTVAKLIILSFISLMAFINFNPDNMYPFVLEDHGGFEGTVKGATIIFFAYLGFDFITTLAEEAKNPNKDLPKSIKFTVATSCLVYCLIAVSLSGMARLSQFPPETAMAQAFTSVGAEWMSIIIYICAFIGISSAAFTKLLVSHRYLQLQNALIRASQGSSMLSRRTDCSSRCSRRSTRRPRSA